MVVRKIRVKTFRNYEKLELEMSPGINLLFGANGSGKTNLLEAVHYCALGRSHRTTQDKEVIARDQDMAACGVTLEKRDGTHDIAIKLLASGEKRKQVFIDGKRAPRLAQMMGMLQCVIFSPEEAAFFCSLPSTSKQTKVPGSRCTSSGISM